MLERVVHELRAGRMLVPTEKMVEWTVDSENGDKFRVDLRFLPSGRPG